MLGANYAPFQATLRLPSGYPRGQGHCGRPDASEWAAESERFQRISLALRHFGVGDRLSASAVSPAPYTALLGIPRDLLQTLSWSRPVPGAAFRLRRQAWYGLLVVHPHRYPPKRPVSRIVARRLARLHPQALRLPSRSANRTFLRAGLPARREGWLRRALRGRARPLVSTWRIASVYLANP